jgi:glycosyltransferase involved in cell wall biosynthesis
MNILQVISNAQLGGAEKHTKLVSIALSRLGHKVWLVHPPGPYSPYFKLAEEKGVYVIETPELRLSSPWKAATVVKQIVQQYRIEAIHSHQYRADFITALVKRHNPWLRAITTIHDQLSKDNIWWQKPHKFFPYYILAYWAMHKLDYIVATSSPVQRYIQKLFKLPYEKVVLIPNSIDTAEIDSQIIGKIPDFKAEFKIPSGSILVSCAAALETRKGQNYLIQAIPLLPEEFRNRIFVLLLGEGSKRMEYEQLAIKLGVAENVKFLGFRKDALKIIKSSDIYVQPSIIDPLPRALLEAMYMQVPVIASGVDGIPDVVRHQETGYLIPPKNPKCIAMAICDLIKHIDLTKKMTSVAYAEVCNKHTMDNMASTITELLIESI